MGDETGSAWFVEFEVLDPSRVPALQRMVAALKAVKDDHGQIELRGGDFQSLLDEKARLHLSEPAGSFDALVDLVGQSEMLLLGIRQVSDRVARLDFDPYSYPYGSAYALERMIEAFGQRVIRSAE